MKTNFLMTRLRCVIGQWPFSTALWRLGVFGLVLLVCGCAGVKPQGSGRPFVFGQDTFAFSNETAWVYEIDAVAGKTRHHHREPPPTYTLHCFVMARAARQFFQNARFDPSQPVSEEETYRRLVRRVASSDARHAVPEEEKIVIPGYANLHEFSSAQEKVLKTQCGGAWRSYLQRGHWRMIFPFSRSHQERTARELIELLRRNEPPVAHVLRFPQLTINHAMVLFAAEEDEREIRFLAYDPNNATKPCPLVFNRARRRFALPLTHYFAGGRVDVYRVYCGWDY